MRIRACILALLVALTPFGCARAEAPADAFMTALKRHCGLAFTGRVITNQPPPATDAFTGQPLLMYVRDCERDEVKIPFHVGTDRSRTWILTRTPQGLRLAHDHRHEDGTPDAVTMYGGETTTAGTAVRQEFPVNAASRALFERENLPASVTNTWAMEVEPGRRFRYELSRPDGRLFQVEFDLSVPTLAK